jgi:tRNA(Ile)-lysidine synthase
VAPRGRAVTALLRPVMAATRALRLAPGDGIVCAVSGGPDSVALLHALATLRPDFGFRLVAAHLNHRLRGAEAARDESFVLQLCERLEVELVVEQARGLEPDAPNLEERARNVRLSYLSRVADRVNARHIALAHHSNDQAETILMRLLRGSGARGLAAMAPCGPGRLWRPLLSVDRATVLAYLGALGATWVVDESNSSLRILRNRLRHELLPLLEREFAPGVTGRLVELANEMRGLDRYLTAAAREELARRGHATRLNLAGFDNLSPVLAQAVLREFVRRRCGHLKLIARDHILAMYRVCLGRKPVAHLELPGRWRFRRHYQSVVLEWCDRPASPVESFWVALVSVGMTQIEPARFTFEATVAERRSDESLPRLATPMEAQFDRDQLAGPLAARNFAAGDRIAPLGMNGTRKVQDVFVDYKLERSRRASWPLICADTQILWIPGITRSRVALVTPATRTVQILRAIEDGHDPEAVVA